MTIARGILRIARFRIDGLAEFSASRPGFLNSLAPLVAFPVAGALLELGQGDVSGGLSDLFASIIALLAPLVISEYFAKRWGMGDHWLGYAVVSNWAQWTMPMALAALLSAFWLFDQFGMATDQNAVIGGVVGVLIYGFALHFFLARHALNLPRLRSAILVLACDIATIVLVMGPRIIAAHVNPGG